VKICERGGHVSEEKKFVSVKIIFSTEIHGQTSDKKQPLFADLCADLLLWPTDLLKSFFY
jgi:hypothetical protein